MLEMMLAAAGSQDGKVEFLIFSNAGSLNEGSEVEFTIFADNHVPGYDYHWEVGGSIDKTLIEGDAQGSLSFNSDDPQVIKIKTLVDEIKDTSETLTLIIRARSGTTIINESDPVTIVYSSHPTGQHVQTATGTREWTVPDEVTEVSVVIVGGGQGADAVFRGRGGDGGALRWMNRLPVTPGEVLTITVGAGGANSADPAQRVGKNTELKRGEFVLLRAAGGGAVGSTSLATDNVGGGDGGRGALGGDHGPGGGGGAGGYSGHGGNAGNALVESHPGEGGGGGGGSYYSTESNDSHHATAGGGVALLGQGGDGSAGVRGDANLGGGGGSSGTTGTWISPGQYGAGARGQSSNVTFGAVTGGNGAVRIIWGPLRLFPNTRTGNL